jgi:type I restriction enzyme, S subunit
VPMSAVEEESGRINLTQTKRAGDLKRGYTPFIDGDVIFAKITPCMENGKAAVVAGLRNGIGFGSTEFHVARPIDGISSKYLFFFLVQRSYRRIAQHNMSGSAGQLRVPRSFFCDSMLPLPPLPEQHRIVTKIEELFGSLDKGIENLKTAQQQLKVYRQAVLKWAFEGRLTNKNAVNGALPDGWKWRQLSELAIDITDGDHSPPPKSVSGIPFITISNIDKVTQKIDFSDTFKVSKEYYGNLKSSRRPRKGDVLYTVTGSFGIPVIIDFEREFCFQRHIGLVRPSVAADQKWLYYVLQSPQASKQAQATATGTAQLTVSLKSLRNFQIPFCGLTEQEAIVAEIESRLSVCDKIEETISNALKQAESLRQSILKKAFEGKLVLQDPNDEPASILLARIKAERGKEIIDTLPKIPMRRARKTPNSDRMPGDEK